MKLVIDLDDHDADHMEYWANKVNGGRLEILVPWEGGYRAVQLDSVKVMEVKADGE